MLWPPKPSSRLISPKSTRKLEKVLAVGGLRRDLGARRNDGFYMRKHFMDCVVSWCLLFARGERFLGRLLLIAKGEQESELWADKRRVDSPRILWLCEICGIFFGFLCSTFPLNTLHETLHGAPVRETPPRLRQSFLHAHDLVAGVDVNDLPSNRRRAFAGQEDAGGSQFCRIDVPF